MFFTTSTVSQYYTNTDTSNNVITPYGHGCSY